MNCGEWIAYEVFWAFEQFAWANIEHVDCPGDKIEEEDDASANQVEEITKVLNTVSNDIANKAAGARDDSNKLWNIVPRGFKDAGNKLNDLIKAGKGKENCISEGLWYLLEEN